MQTFSELIAACRTVVKEIMPWDLIEQLNSQPNTILLDVREESEFNTMHLDNSLHVPRGILETSCEYGFDETIPMLVEAKKKPIVIVCRSGNRSLLAAKTMMDMGYQNVVSLNTGLRGWNDYEQPLVNNFGETIDIDDADEFFTSKVSPEQMNPSA